MSMCSGITKTAQRNSLLKPLGVSRTSMRCLVVFFFLVVFFWGGVGGWQWGRERNKLYESRQNKTNKKQTHTTKKKTFVSVSRASSLDNIRLERRTNKRRRTSGADVLKKGFRTTAPDLYKNNGLMYCQKRRHFMFVNIPPAVVVDVRDNCWFNSNCSVLICTGVVSDINVTACTLLQKVLKTVFFLFVSIVFLNHAF